MKYAFRCKNCGFLHHAEHAGDNDCPHACRVCNSGVSFHPQTGIKTFHTENWEVLADVPSERLKDLGLTGGQIARHRGLGKPLPASPQCIKVTTEETPAGHDEV